jgi:copper chaperone CopZ
MSVSATHRISVTVKGMTCEHCVRAVTEELQALDGVSDVIVTLSSGDVALTSERELTRAEIAAAIEEAGYALVD